MERGSAGSSSAAMSRGRSWTTVGVTSGASVPEVLVRGVLERLADYGYDIVQPVTTANETLVFALPREIRPARR